LFVWVVLWVLFLFVCSAGFGLFGVFTEQMEGGHQNNSRF